MKTDIRRPEIFNKEPEGTAWPNARLGDLIVKNDAWIEIDPAKTYKELTVRLWGRGIVLRREVVGSEIGSSQRIRVRAGQFIVSRIDARNGAFGLVPQEFDGAVVTNDFPVFDINSEWLLPEFLGWTSHRKAFVDACRSASEGTTNRVRLKEELFYKIEIPFPPLSVQRRIVEKIERLVGKIEEVRTLRRKAALQTELVLNSTIDLMCSKPRESLPAGWNWVRLNDLGFGWSRYSADWSIWGSVAQERLCG